MRNICSFAGDPESDDVNTLVVRGLLRYQLNRSWYLISSPIIAFDWTQPEGKGWIVPVGGGLGYSFRLGGQPIQVSLEGYYNAVKPQVTGEKLWVTGRFASSRRFFPLSEPCYWRFFGLSVERNMRIPNRLTLLRPRGNPTAGFAKSFQPSSNVVAMALWAKQPSADVGRANS